MPAKIKQGRYIDGEGVQQDVVFIGAEKAIFDDEGNRLDEKLESRSKASGLTVEDTEGILGVPEANVNFQALVDAIANKVMNELVTNSALTAQLANYVTKAMMSNEQVNDNDHVPTSSLVYNMNEDITQLNSDLFRLSAKFPMFEIYIDETGNKTTVQESIEALYPNLTRAIVIARYRLATGSGVVLIYNAGEGYGTCLCADRSSNRLVCGIYGNSGWNWTFPA